MFIVEHEYNCDTLNSLYCNVHVIYKMYVLSYVLYYITYVTHEICTVLYCIVYVTHEHVLLNVNKISSFFHYENKYMYLIHIPTTL